MRHVLATAEGGRRGEGRRAGAEGGGTGAGDWWQATIERRVSAKHQRSGADGTEKSLRYARGTSNIGAQTGSGGLVPRTLQLQRSKGVIREGVAGRSHTPQ